MKHPDPNATIQLDRVDRLDDIQLDDFEPSDAQHRGESGSTNSTGPRGTARPLTSSGPPPLPPGASLPPATSYAPLPTRTPTQNGAPRALGQPASKGKKVVQTVLFVALLGAAIVGGLKMGASLRATPPPAKVAAPILVVTPPAPSASAVDMSTAGGASKVSAPAVITMPTIEMSDPPAEPKAPSRK